MRRIHAGLVATLLLGAAGLATATVWGARMRGGVCSQYTPPGWVLGAVLAGGLVVLVAAFIGSVAVEGAPILQRVYFSLALMEAAWAVAVVIYLATKSNLAYTCG